MRVRYMGLRHIITFFWDTLDAMDKGKYQLSTELILKTNLNICLRKVCPYSNGVVRVR